jgi:hypothetical protein
LGGGIFTPRPFDISNAQTDLNLFRTPLQLELIIVLNNILNANEYICKRFTDWKNKDASWRACKLPYESQKY